MLKWEGAEKDGGSKVLDAVSDFRLQLNGVQMPRSMKTWWSVLIELRETSIDQFVEAVGGFGNDLLVPVAYGPQDREAVRPRQPVTIFARAPLISELNRTDNPYNVTSVHLGNITPISLLDGEATMPDLLDIDVSADTVVIAVIDDGIAVAHDLLRKGPVSSRVEHATVFAAPPVPGGTSTVGRALDKDEIDRNLVAATFNDLLDEDLFYQRVGIIDWSADTVSPVASHTSHGTHITALAAGHDMRHGCDTRPVICASLPPRIVEDTTGVDSLPTLYLAFHILARQARRFRLPCGNPAPVVFNFSFGNTGGPHDGTGLFAVLFEHYFGPNGVMCDEDQTAWLTLPAGNANLGRLHAVVESGTTKVDLTVQPNDRTPSVMQVWMPNTPSGGAPELAKITVTTPSGQSVSIESQPGQSAMLVDDDGNEVARLACQDAIAPVARALVTLSIVPTDSLSQDGPLAPAGTWRVAVTRGANTGPDPIDLWIRRDETLPGMRSGGRQAWFSNDDYVRFDTFGVPLPVDPPGVTSPIRRSGTISGFAGGASPIVVAAYTERSAEMSLYSAAGPLAARTLPPPPDRDGPDVTAKGDDSYALRGVISAGSRSGSWARLSGTSVAAPRVARAAADNITGWAGTGREWSHAGAAAHPFPLRDAPSPERAGVGGIKVPFPAVRD
ncbi:S8 family serine peptidase [Tateyamaria sp. SN6-1]|uniref:S8 family serine peptidase n=1 Tax=Tateyamaria sp. SN6-1 TaxID=3092148 RepID=UPI0039F59E7B